ncbi:SHOCT domain-containing protein [Thalassotalea sp. G2M2-11]|uniref:SHOCT domain-containing protein n=1 Tax=Thalassotalea sp. G2M2-11 TaxID=2787627 RepID=UPI0019D129DF|nr:SHOCT domain-containing protein [Thalassotalea sp. G2M2-11]
MKRHLYLTNQRRKLLLLLSLFFNFILSSHAEKLTFTQLTLPTNKSHTTWQHIIINPLTQQQFFTSEHNGKIKLYDSKGLSSKELLNVVDHYPNLVKLTAFSAHPSFKLVQQQGYLTFYTAHIESSKKNTSTTIINAPTYQGQTPYELVLIEWQFNDENLQKLKVTATSRKEIFRIGVPSQQTYITQLAFNPFIQPWQNHANQLFAVLMPDENNTDIPLYSGAILRVALEKFGAKNYRIPPANAFIDEPNINNEILISQLNLINNIHWFKQNPNQLYIRHRGKQQQKLSRIQLGDDFTSASKKADHLTDIKLSPNSSNGLIYRGEQLKAHRNKLLYLTWQEQWLLVALAPHAPYQPEIITSLEKLAMSPTAKPILTTDHQDELLVFDQSSNSAFQLFPAPVTAANKQHNPSHVDKPDENFYLAYFLLLTALFLLIALFYFSKKSSLSLLKKYLYEQFAQFEVDKHNNIIALYHRHQSEPAIKLPLNEVVESKIHLNDVEICHINSDENSVFSNNKEQKFNALLQQEKREKMIDERVRKYELILQDTKKKSYRICLYFRKGNQRMTKSKFDESTEQLLNWCWLFSAMLHPQHTEKRKILVTPTITSVSNTQKAPLSQQSNVETQKRPTNSDEHLPSNTASVNSVKKTDSEPHVSTPANQQASDIARDHPASDTSIVQALEKLAALKQQNLLSEQEFEQAKATILHQQKNTK